MKTSDVKHAYKYISANKQMRVCDIIADAGTVFY